MVTLIESNHIQSINWEAAEENAVYKNNYGIKGKTGKTCEISYKPRV